MHRFHVSTVIVQLVPHEQRLFQQIAEIESPAEAFDAARERRRVTHHDNDLAVQFLRKPGGEEDGEWSLQEHPSATNAADEERTEILKQEGELFA